jgi:hypothetical protein
VNSIISRIKHICLGASLAAVLMVVTATPSRCDGPLVPAPKLPPPPLCTTSDGTVYYADGSILYPDGTYVYPDGTVVYL